MYDTRFGAPSADHVPLMDCSPYMPNADPTKYSHKLRPSNSRGKKFETLTELVAWLQSPQQHPNTKGDPDNERDMDSVAS